MNPYEPPQSDLQKPGSQGYSWLWLLFIIGVPLITIFSIVLLFA